MVYIECKKRGKRHIVMDSCTNLLTIMRSKQHYYLKYSFIKLQNAIDYDEVIKQECVFIEKHTEIQHRLILFTSNHENQVDELKNRTRDSRTILKFKNSYFQYTTSRKASLTLFRKQNSLNVN